MLSTSPKHQRLAWALCVALQAILPALAQETGPLPAEAKNTPQQLSHLAPRIALAIDQGIDHLLRQQHRDGSWSGEKFAKFGSGPTAFCAFALVESGLSAHAPAIQRALDFLRAHPPAQTYSVSALLLLLAEINDPAHRDWAEDLLDQLLSWESEQIPGTWAYPAGAPDLSNTQFVVLGMWSAWRMGLKPPLKVCQRIASSVHDHHQEEPFARKGSENRGASRSAAKDVAGFKYGNKPRGPQASGTMTAAGVGILRILKFIHGKKLGRKLSTQMNGWEHMGLNWLEGQPAPTGRQAVPSRRCFYHYSLERLGAFLETDRIAGTLWYETGAREILALQEAHGGWDQLETTCYALLFLSRASHPSVTGLEREPREDQWGQESGVVRLRATGDMEIIAWVEAIESEQDLRVEGVDWMVDGQAVEAITADPQGTWSGERFPMRWSASVSGEHEIVATIRGIGADGLGLELRSDPLRIQCRWTPGAWLKPNTSDAKSLPLSNFAATASASSEFARHPAALAIDGFEATPWVAAAGDHQPTLSFRFGKPKRTDTLLLSHPASSIEGLSRYSGATLVRIAINGKDSEHALLPQSPLPLEIELPKRSRIRTLSIQILASSGPPDGLQGFSEIALRD